MGTDVGNSSATRDSGDILLWTVIKGAKADAEARPDGNRRSVRSVYKYDVLLEKRPYDRKTADALSEIVSSYKLIVEEIEAETNWYFGFKKENTVGRKEIEITPDDLIVENNELYGVLYEGFAVSWEPDTTFECGFEMLSSGSCPEVYRHSYLTIRRR